MRRVAAVLLLLTACSSDPADVGSAPASTSNVAAPTSTTGRPLDVLQVAGAWTVSEAGATALYAVGTKVTFAGDGSYFATSPGTTRTGTWKVRGAELDLLTGGTMYGYAAAVSPRELHLGIGPPGMTLMRA